MQVKHKYNTETQILSFYGNSTQYIKDGFVPVREIYFTGVKLRPDDNDLTVLMYMILRSYASVMFLQGVCPLCNVLNHINGQNLCVVNVSKVHNSRNPIPGYYEHRLNTLTSIRYDIKPWQKNVQIQYQVPNDQQQYTYLASTNLHTVCNDTDDRNTIISLAYKNTVSISHAKKDVISHVHTHIAHHCGII